jgi:predicted nucleic acid-binding protein
VKVAVDTNVLAYAEGVDDPERQLLAGDLMRQLPVDSIVIPIQALGELYNVLVRKAGRTANRARDAVTAWRDNFDVAATTPAAMTAAVDLAADHRLAIWDSVMIAVAAENGCRLLLSEDLHDGFSWRGVTVANPFAAVRHPLLDALLATEDDR